MPGKVKKIRFIFFIYWFLLAYIIAALVWWFIALSRQNEQMMEYKVMDLKLDDPAFQQKLSVIREDKKRKTAQYIGEGSIFLLLIAAGAIFVYRSAKRQFTINRQQQHFMIAVTHELKTPIAIAKLNLETLQKRKLDEQQQHKLLANTLQEANRMNALCNNMLLSSQFDTGGYRITREEINIGELAEQCVEEFRSRYPLKQIGTDIDEGLYVMGDGLLLQLAINNLLDNAFKYAPKDTAVHISVKPTGNLVRVSVADEGPGILDADKLKVFEKFHRLGNEATRQSKGTGLGLYLTHKIISEHNGRIFVKDNQPHGAIMVVEMALQA